MIKFLTVFLFPIFAFSASSVSVTRMPAGTILITASSICPQYTVAADGTSYIRTGIYQNLFAAIGTTHGFVDGTHFNVPDYRGRFIRGVDGGIARDPDRASRTAMNAGGNTGDNVGTVQTSAAPNITGYLEFTSLAPFIDTNVNYSGSVVSRGTASMTGYGSSGAANRYKGFGIDASQSSLVYSSTTEVRPTNATVKFCIWY